jgi:Flp pilus assembly pilin Flp
MQAGGHMLKRHSNKQGASAIEHALIAVIVCLTVAMFAEDIGGFLFDEFMQIHDAVAVADYIPS